MELHGARVLITGASRGIGAELARSLAAAGAQLALVARSREPLEKVAADTGGIAYPTDLTDRAESGTLLQRVEADGPVDVLINNAGVDTTARLTTFPADEIDDLLELNLHVPIQLCRQVLPGMVERRRGHLVNMSSMAATLIAPGIAAYCASKAGLSHFHAALRAEVRSEGAGDHVGTTLVEIGPTKTGMVDTLRSYGPTRRSVARLEKLQLSYDLDVDRVVDEVVGAIRGDKQHVRLPRRAMAFPILGEATRRITDLLMTGVDQRAANPD